MTIAPLRVAVVNDYELVVKGVASMLSPFADRVTVVELAMDATTGPCPDVALVDLFGAAESTAFDRCREIRREHRADHVVLYTCHVTAGIVERARQVGFDGVVAKSESAAHLVDEVEAISARAAVEPTAGGPGVLTSREHEILELMATGCTNQAIARSLYVSEETVKTYAKRLFRKLGVRNRVEAAIRASEFGVTAR